jgi:hypothetical protein
MSESGVGRRKSGGGGGVRTSTRSKQMKVMNEEMFLFMRSACERSIVTCLLHFTYVLLTSSLPHFDAVASMVDIEDHFAGSYGSSMREALNN